jgi:hypothetical protein
MADESSDKDTGAPRKDEPPRLERRATPSKGEQRRTNADFWSAFPHHRYADTSARRHTFPRLHGNRASFRPGALRKISGQNPHFAAPIRTNPHFFAVQSAFRAP